MGKYLSAIVGAAVALVGLVLLLKWNAAVLIMFKGTVPAMLIFGGVIAVIAGISEVKDELASKKEEKK